ncbi:MAG: tetratricopeptide repeat protein [Pseudomonadota bacterium]
MNAFFDTRRSIKTPLAACLLTFLQSACTYTPVYDGRSGPESNFPGANERAGPPDQEAAEMSEHQVEGADQPTRVAVVSPDAIKHKPAVSNKDGAAAKLRSQATDAMAEGQTARAERLLNRALRISPRSPETYHQLASIKLEQGASGQALQLARKGLSLCDPDSKLAEQLQRLASRASGY